MADSEDKPLTTISETEKVEEQIPLSEKDSETVSTKTKQGLSYFTLALLIIIAVATAAGGFYLWQQQQILIEQQQASSDDLKLQLRQFKNQLDSKTSSLNQSIQNNNTTIQNLAADQKQLVDISQKAIEVTNRGQKGWVLAEIDYLLRIANRRLQIARDINGAIAALHGANQRIYDLGDLSLFKIRQQLSKDIGQLKALHQIDVNNTAMAIDQMIAHLSELPFKSVEDEVKAQFKNNSETSNNQGVIENSDGSFVDSVISTVMKIGEIKVHQRSLEPASSAVQQSQQEQILRSHLLGARLAVLRYDQQQFSHDLQLSQNILHLHYKESDNRVAQMLKDLSNFLNLNLTPDLPDITKSWRLLQTTIQTVEITNSVNKFKKKQTKKKSKPASEKIKEAEVL